MQYLVVTGGCGFIGSHVIDSALKLGYNVINIDRLSYAADLKNTSQHSSNKSYIHLEIDIRNPKELSAVFEKYLVIGVIHLAAETHVDNSIENPRLFAETNIIGTLNLLECWREMLKCHKSIFKKFLHVSTDEVYGDLPREGLFTESTAYAPSSPYSASKAGSDHLVRAWGRTYGLPYIITNCSNNFGPRQHKEKLIPKTVNAFLRRERMPIYGDGTNIRDWLFVADHADAILKLFGSDVIGETFNVGTHNEVSNLNIVSSIAKHMNRLLGNNFEYQSLVEFVADRSGHDQRYAIDATKLNRQIVWGTKRPFEENLEDTVRWFVEND